jgi:hypothetical protein
VVGMKRRDIYFRRLTCKLASFGSVLLRRGVSHK